MPDFGYAMRDTECGMLDCLLKKRSTISGTDRCWLEGSDGTGISNWHPGFRYPVSEIGNLVCDQERLIVVIGYVLPEWSPCNSAAGFTISHAER